jgi:hypothetical protein
MLRAKEESAGPCPPRRPHPSRLPPTADPKHVLERGQHGHDHPLVGGRVAGHRDRRVPHVLVTHTEFGRASARFEFGGQSGVIDGKVEEVWSDETIIFTAIGEVKKKVK